MYIYPGGYEFFDYFLSDLGRQTAINGDSNPTASILFSCSMFLGALFLLIFWLLSPVLLKSYQSKLYVLVQIGSVLGLLSTPVMASIGIFPTDTQSEVHNIIGIIFFALAGASIVLYSIFFIILFFSRLQEQNRLFFAMISCLVIILISFIIITFVSELPSWLIIVAVFGIVLLSVILKLKFPHFIDMVSFLISAFMFIIISTICFVLIGAGLTAILEITFVYGMIIWTLINNFRIFLISLEND
jgi:hypothetical protein